MKSGWSSLIFLRERIDRRIEKILSGIGSCRENSGDENIAPSYRETNFSRNSRPRGSDVKDRCGSARPSDLLQVSGHQSKPPVAGRGSREFGVERKSCAVLSLYARKNLRKSLGLAR